MAAVNKHPKIFEPKKTLLMTNLAINIGQETLMKLFALYGEIIYMALLRSMYDRPYTYAIVAYSEIFSANAAKCAIGFHGINDKILDITLLWHSEYRHFDDLPDSSEAELEKRVVYVTNVAQSLDLQIMFLEFSKFGVIEDLNLINEPTALNIRITYKYAISAAAAAALVYLPKQDEREMKVYLVLGSRNGSQFRESFRVRLPDSTDSIEIISDAEIDSIYKKLRFDISALSLINKEILQDDVTLSFAPKLFNFEKQIVPLCEWTEETARVVQVLASDNVVTLLIDMHYRVAECALQCETCANDPNIDCWPMLPSQSNAAVVPNWEVAYLLELKVKGIEAYTLGFKTSSERYLCESETVTLASEEHRTRPLGCVMLRIHVKANTNQGEELERPDFVVYYRNLNYLCPKIVVAKDVLPNSNNKIPNTIVVESKIMPVKTESLNLWKANYREKFHNPSLPSVSALPVVKITCVASREDVFEFPVVYYPSVLTDCRAVVRYN